MIYYVILNIVKDEEHVVGKVLFKNQDEFLCHAFGYGYLAASPTSDVRVIPASELNLK